MAVPTWPPSLPPAPVRDGYAESVGVLSLRTPVDAGPAKMRYRGRRPDTLTLTFLMNTAQVATLDAFVRNVLRGISRFGFTHPRTGSAVVCRIVSGPEGAAFELNRIGATLFDVKMTFEVMP